MKDEGKKRKEKGVFSLRKLFIEFIKDSKKDRKGPWANLRLIGAGEKEMAKGRNLKK